MARIMRYRFPFEVRNKDVQSKLKRKKLQYADVCSYACYDTEHFVLLQKEWYGATATSAFGDVAQLCVVFRLSLCNARVCIAPGGHAKKIRRCVGNSHSERIAVTAYGLPIPGNDSIGSGFIWTAHIRIGVPKAHNAFATILQWAGIPPVIGSAYWGNYCEETKNEWAGKRQRRDYPKYPSYFAKIRSYCKPPTLDVPNYRRVSLVDDFIRGV